MHPTIMKVHDGHLFPYSLVSLKKDYPNVSFPSDLSGVDLSQYGAVLISSGTPCKDLSPTRVAMHQFLYALRDFGMREQFERYMLALDGHARDYWFTAPYVNRGHTCVKHFAEFFALTKPDLDTIFSVAGSIEE